MGHIYIAVLKCRCFDLMKGMGKRFFAPLIGVMSFVLKAIGFKSRALKYALMAHRAAVDKISFNVVDNCLKNADCEQHLHDLVSASPDTKEVAGRILITRWPVFEDDKVVSKGILIITFTRTFAFFQKHVDIGSLESFFNIVLEPSWAGYFDPDILFWNYRAKCPVFVQASEITDMASIDSLGGKLVPVSIGASDWVDHRIFYPTNEERIFDSVYVTNTSRGKRTHRYLKALFEIKNQGVPDYKGALVCAGWGGRVKEIKQLYKYYEMDNICDLFFELKHEDLRKILCQSKVNILLSKKEGSNRSLFEAMFCNTPVLALVDNLGVNKSYLNEFTGMLVWDHHLPDALLSMRDKWANYRPREWAMNNISPQVTSDKLCRIIVNNTGDELLKQDLEKGKGCFVKVNSPEISYFDFLCFDKVSFNSRLLKLFSASDKKNNIIHNLKALLFEFQEITGPHQHIQ